MLETVREMAYRLTVGVSSGLACVGSGDSTAAVAAAGIGRTHRPCE